MAKTMNIKKRVSLLVLALFICVGCSASGNQEEDTTKLKVAVFSGAYDSTYWKKAKELFENRHPNVEVVLDINSNIGNILMPRVDVKDVPDVIYLGSSNASGLTKRMIEDHLLASLEDAFPASLQDRFIEPVLDSTVLRPYEDQQLYLAPLYYNVTGLWYNQTLFQKQGYEVPTTWDEFFALGDQAKQDGLDLFTYQGLNPTYLEAMLWPMLAEQIGMDGLDAIYTYQKDAWARPEIQSVIDVFARLGKEGYMREDTIVLNYMEAQRRFINKEALFLPCGNWLSTEMKDDLQEGDALSFLSVPKFQKENPTYVQIMVEQIYVPKDARQLELGKQFVAEQFSEENISLNQTLSGGFVPVKQETTMDAQPFSLIHEGAIPLASTFMTGHDYDMDTIVFELLSKVIAQDISSSEMIQELNNITNSIN